MLSPERLGYATKPISHELLNDHNLTRFVLVFDALFKCSDWDLSPGTVLVQSFVLYGQKSLSSCPPSCVSCHSKRFRREENVSPRGPPPWFTCQRTSANVEGAGKNQSRQSYTCLLTTNCHFPADLGHLHLHGIPKVLLYLGTTVFANLIWIQDWAGYFSVRWRGILKLSTHTE